MIPTVIKLPPKMALEPCPFCNGAAQLQVDCDDTYFVSCSNMQCLVLPLTLPFRLRTDAVKAWNRRSAPVVSDPILPVGAKPVLIENDWSKS